LIQLIDNSLIQVYRSLNSLYKERRVGDVPLAQYMATAAAAAVA
jgi:hypothetical protein